MLNEEMQEVVTYYFGCIGGAGHYMHASPHQPDLSLGDRQRTSHFTEQNPWGYKIDSGLCPNGEQSTFRRDETEGPALIHHKDGWTALSFWDRSVDKRGGCNSNFLAKGTFTFTQMIELAKYHFPHVMNRFKFEIVDVTPKEQVK